MRIRLSALLTGFSVLACAAAAAAAGPVQGLDPPPGAIVFSPSDTLDVQAAVDSYPAGTSFWFEAGVYRAQSIRPKKNDRFYGAYGAVLNGAVVLNGFGRSGTLYVAEAPLDPNAYTSGYCEKSRPRCDHPQDLYIDGQPLVAVARLKDVGPGTFFIDYDARTVTVADDPSGHTVELSYRPFAFGGAASGVTVQNLVVENYAATNQQGAVGNHGEGRNWTIRDNEIRWNHGIGAVTGTGGRVLDNLIHHNGEMGIGGGGMAGALVRGNEISFNVWNGVSCGWECGGAKFAVATDLHILANYVHDNAGDGLWTDIDCSDVTYEKNRIENNLGAGISHEISGRAVIRNNSFLANGAKTFGWGWQGQVQIQNSSDTEVYGNTLVLDARRGGNGLMIIQQDRGARHMPKNNWIHDNDVTLPGGVGALAGWFADYKPAAFAKANNRWDDNRYHLYAMTPEQDVWGANDWMVFADWQATGQDQHSTADTDVDR